MTPFAAGNDSKGLLAVVHESLTKLQGALHECHTQQAALAPSEKPATATKPTPTLSPPVLKAATQNALHHVISAKVAHDAILRDVDLARVQTTNDQDLSMRSRGKLSSLLYERRQLEREIAACRAQPAPNLTKLAPLLPTLPADASDDAQAHAASLTALNAELARRRKVRLQVEETRAGAQTRRDALARAKTQLSALPDAMRALGTAVEPVRALLDGGGGAQATPAEVAAARRLPAPLYVLAREALAYRSSRPDVLAVDAGDEEGEALGEHEPSGAYRVSPQVVRLAVRDPEHAAATGTEDSDKLEVAFQYHEELGVVSVLARALQPGADADAEAWTAEPVTKLFPYDFGTESPRGGAAGVRFDTGEAGAARAFVWANVICGVPCLPSVPSGNGGQFANWPTNAAALRGHLRFAEVVERLLARLRAFVALRKQESELGQGRVEMEGVNVGAGAAKLDTFDRVVAERDAKGSRRYQAVVKGATVRVEWTVTIAADYPDATPVFRVVGTEGGKVVERDWVEMEQAVNGMSAGDHIRKEWLLSAQVGFVVEAVGGVDRGDRGDDTAGEKRLPASLARLLC